MNTKELNLIFKNKMFMVYKFLIKNGCSHHDAEDIVQDTFLKAIQYIDGVNLNKINSWLFKTALNRFYDLCRKNSRHPKINIEDSNFLNNLYSEFICEDYILKIENKKEIAKVLDKLKPAYKNLLILKYDMNLSYKEISISLDISEKNVKTYLYRARNSFKNYWEDI